MNRYRWVLVLRWVALAAALPVCLHPPPLVAQTTPSYWQLPGGDWQAPIQVHADRSTQWEEGAYQVVVLEGNCRLRQGTTELLGERAVLWIDRQPAGPFAAKVLAYFEENVRYRTSAGGRVDMRDQTYFGRFLTQVGLEFVVARPQPVPTPLPDVYARAKRARHEEPPAYRHVGFLQQEEEVAPVEGGTTLVTGGRRVQIFPRTNIPIQLETRPGPTPQQQIYIVTQGVRAVIEGVEGTAVGEVGKVILEADRVVVWGPSLGSLIQNRQAYTAENLPLEFYLEGNVVFRQGERVVYAERMYYNATQHFGTILDAEIFTGVPNYEGVLRLKAEVLQQLNDQQFRAYEAAITTSRLGGPRYWVQANRVEFEDRQQVQQDFVTGAPAVDPQTGELLVEHDLRARARNNFVYVAGLPVFYWPSLETNLTRPTFYITRASGKKDDVFGNQLMVDWDAYQLFGWREPPEGTDWTFSTDYLSRRGLAGGTRFEYERAGGTHLPGIQRGFIDAWGIRDTGFDNLGADRRALVPPLRNRGRAIWQHRHELGNGLRFQAEAGWISDRNFLEQYFEREWDLEKDQATGFELKWLRANREWRLSSAFRVNDFFTVPEWMPRLDHYISGQSLLGDHLTWYAHSHVGYTRLRVADPPTDPTDAATFQPLAWEVPAKGLRAATRQELDWPVQLGWFKVVPYALGEVAYWQEDLTNTEQTRLLGQLGVRASVPIWSVDPTYQNMLWNLNGLAHKVHLQTDIYWADANRDVGIFPLYDSLDDNSIEHFRRRFYFQTFGGLPGGTLPIKFDERYFALRSGLQRWVSGPSTEIADDLVAARLDLRQRWQTKRGAPGTERTLDWIVFNMGGTFFPKSDRDNFGQVAGLLEYDFRWHLGDRFTVVSDGFADTFGQGLRSATIGGVLSRPDLGRLYVGFRSIDGPFTSNVINATLTYRMSEKWLANLGSSVDLASTGNIGQSVSLVRIGESMLLKFGFYVDSGRNNVGLDVSIEPRFLPSSRLDRVAGVKIPPVGARGLE